jgi:hypothetical protein
LVAVLLTKEALDAYDVDLSLYIEDPFVDSPQAHVQMELLPRDGAAREPDTVGYAIVIAGTADGEPPSYLGPEREVRKIAISLADRCPGNEYCETPGHAILGEWTSRTPRLQFGYSLTSSFVSRGASSAVVTLPGVGRNASLMQAGPADFNLVYAPARLGLATDYYGANYSKVSISVGGMAESDDLDKIHPPAELREDSLRWSARNARNHIPKLKFVLSGDDPIVYEDQVLRPRGLGPVPVYGEPSGGGPQLPLVAKYRISRPKWRSESQLQLFYAGGVLALGLGLVVATLQSFLERRRHLLVISM